MKNVLVIAAHPDDELLGVGGTVRKLVNEGVLVRAVILAEGITSREGLSPDEKKIQLEKLQENAMEAANIIGYESIDFCGFPDNRMDRIDLLDVIKLVSKYVDIYQPDTIFTHHHGDLNIDHRITCEAVLTACRPVDNCCVRRIYTFETPSSTEWDFNYEKPFTPNVFFDISSTLIAKIEGMQCYQSEKREYPHPRSIDSLDSLASFRGSIAGFKKAEGFMLVRECFDANHEECS